MEGREEVSAFATGERQGLQERSDEGPRARCVEPCRRFFASLAFSEPCGLPALRSRAFTGALAAAPAARQLRYAAGLRVAGTSW